MQSRTVVSKHITECLKKLKPDGICALFLISLEQTDRADDPGEEESLSAVISRFFRQTDITGTLGEGQYVIFPKGHVTGNVVYEKTAALIRALRNKWSQKDACRDCWIGVYMFQVHGENFAYLLGKAQDALRTAKEREDNHFFVSVSDRIREKVQRENSAAESARIMMQYIDEGVRLIEVGETLRTIYMSPGFCRRLAVREGTVKADRIQIHPEDREAYERYVRDTAKGGEAVNCGYRISIDGKKWIFCRIRLLLVRSGDETHHPIVIEVSYNMEGLEYLERQLEEKKEWLGFVAGHTEYQLWEVDISQKVFRMLHADELMEGRTNVYRDFPESMIENGRIHSSSAEAFREFAQEMLGGQMRGAGNFMIQYRRTSCYGWAALYYRMICDGNGHPVKAIGIKKDLSHIPYENTGASRHRLMPSEIYSTLYCFLQANLTGDAVEQLLLEGGEQIRLTQHQTFDQFLKKNAGGLFSRKEQAQVFLKQFSRDRMLQEFENGRHWFYERCKMTDFNGKICWIAVGVNLSRNSETNEVVLYAYLNRLEQRIRWEKLLEIPVQTDPGTGIYSVNTQRQVMEKFLTEDCLNGCVLAQICMEGMEELARTERSQRIKEDIVRAFHVFLNTDCLLGWKNKAGLLVVFPGESDMAKVRFRLEEAFFP